jgi:hypothetical protein
MISVKLTSNARFDADFAKFLKAFSVNLPQRPETMPFVTVAFGAKMPRLGGMS